MVGYYLEALLAHASAGLGVGEYCLYMLGKLGVVIGRKEVAVVAVVYELGQGDRPRTNDRQPRRHRLHRRNALQLGHAGINKAVGGGIEARQELVGDKPG